MNIAKLNSGVRTTQKKNVHAYKQLKKYHYLNNTKFQKIIDIFGKNLLLYVFRIQNKNKQKLLKGKNVLIVIIKMNLFLNKCY